MLQHINIRIKGSEENRYKSITELIWNDMPGLCVLTGLNGAGKTQLMELLAYGLSRSPFPDGRTINIPIDVEGDTINRGDIAYLPSGQALGGSAPVQLTSQRQLKMNLHQQIAYNQSDLSSLARKRIIERELDLKIESISSADFADRVPDELLYMLNNVNIISEMAPLFLTYRAKVLRIIEKTSKTRLEAEQELGPSPWGLINEALASAAFPYTLAAPYETEIFEPFEVLLHEQNKETKIRPIDLSSGEKVILEIMLWVFISKKRTAFPKLFLMDEPDAHLHPSMARQFIDVIKNVLVDKHGIRVVMTTHSPSTVALAPENAIFEMTREMKEVKRSPSTSSSVSLLTAGLVTVGPNTKHVIVEDQDDVTFYSAVRDILTDYGPRRDAQSLAPSPTITFLPASTGSNAKKIPGGCKVVYGWVSKFDADPLKDIFRGLVDKDTSNSDCDRVYTTVRYSIENYLLDPFNVFAVLLPAGGLTAIPDLAIGVGEEHLIAALEPSKLQSIVDVICNTVSSEQTELKAITGTADVRFTNGVSLSYPKWMITYRGRDLLPLFQRAWGGPNVIKPPSLLDAFRRVRLVPDELATQLRRAQN